MLFGQKYPGHFRPRLNRKTKVFNGAGRIYRMIRIVWEARH